MPHAMQVRMPRLAFILAALLPIAACNRAPEPVAAVSPGANAPMNAASAELDGITLQARLIDTATLAAVMAKQYGISQAEGQWLLLLTLRDAQGNGVPAGAVQIDARVGDLTQAPRPITLRSIQVDGINDLIGLVEATPPTTLRVEIDARRGGASSQMRFSRDLPRP